MGALYRLVTSPCGDIEIVIEEALLEESAPANPQHPLQRVSSQHPLQHVSSQQPFMHFLCTSGCGFQVCLLLQSNRAVLFAEPD